MWVRCCASAPASWGASSGRRESCVCDEGYNGYDCSRRSCPEGDDPLTEHDWADADDASNLDEIQPV